MRRQCLNVRLGVQDHLSISMCRIWARTVFELFKAPSPFTLTSPGDLLSSTYGEEEAQQVAASVPISLQSI